MSKIWVGKTDGGAALVFDPEMQLPDCPHIFLWEVTTGSMEHYVATMVRAAISTIKDDALVRRYSTSYLGWKAAQGKSWLNSERSYYESRVSRARDESLMTPEQRHKQRLDQMGLFYGGVRALTTGRRQRNAHCYECKEPLNSLAKFECEQCGWILCDCGACGCGYGGHSY